MQRRFAHRSLVVGLLVLAAATSPVRAQIIGPMPPPVPDSVIFIVEDRIDGMGTLALISRDSGEARLYLAEVVPSAVTPQMINAILQRVEQHHHKTPNTGVSPMKLNARTPLGSVASEDRAAVNAIVAKLKRKPQRVVKGIGMQTAVGVEVRGGR